MSNMLREQFGEPVRVIARAAQVYMDNVERVNTTVQEGLLEEIKQKFEETLPTFVGFLAGHGLATLLMRVPNPIVIAIGSGLKVLLTGAGYIMQIDFLGTAMERLLQAATPP